MANIINAFGDTAVVIEYLGGLRQRVIPFSIRHNGNQWLLRAWCCEKDEEVFIEMNKIYDWCEK